MLRHSHTPWIAILATAVFGGACGISDGPVEDYQLLRGRIPLDRYGADVVGVRLSRSGQVMATATVDDAGRFQIAVPRGTSYGLEVVTRDAALALLVQDLEGPSPLTFQVCHPGADFDLGVIHPLDWDGMHDGESSEGFDTDPDDGFDCGVPPWVCGEDNGDDCLEPLPCDPETGSGCEPPPPCLPDDPDCIEPPPPCLPDDPDCIEPPPPCLPDDPDCIEPPPCLPDDPDCSEPPPPCLPDDSDCIEPPPPCLPDDSDCIEPPPPCLPDDSDCIEPPPPCLPDDSDCIEPPPCTDWDLPGCNPWPCNPDTGVGCDDSPPVDCGNDYDAPICWPEPNTCIASPDGVWTDCQGIGAAPEHPIPDFGCGERN